MAITKPEDYLSLLQTTLNCLDLSAVDRLAEAFLQVREHGGHIYTFGNGGSGATASHAAGDFLKGASYGLDRRFKMICLNDNLPALMAIANDIGYEDIFVEQLRNFIGQNDLVIGISGSGNSENVVRALALAKEKGVKTVAMCGFKGGKIAGMADLVIHVPAMDMEVTEDAHMVVFNMVKKVVMHRLLGDNPSMGSVYDARTP